MEYVTVIKLGSVLLAIMTNWRVAYVLALRWNLYSSSGDFPLFEVFCAGIASVVFWYVSAAAIGYGGVMAGLISVAAVIPLSGAIWLFIVGGNKVIERLLSNLMKKVDKANS